MVALFILLSTPQTLRSANSSAHRLCGQSSPLVGPLSFCLFADFHPFNSLVSGKLTLRQVNGGKPFPEPCGQSRGYTLPPAQNRRPARGCTVKTDRGNTFQAAFDNHPHCSGIMHIDRGVIAVINAAHHKVGFAVEHRMECQLDAIGGRTGTLIDRQSHILAKQLIMNRFRHGKRTHYPNAASSAITKSPQRTEKLYQLADSFPNDTVVIGNQYQRSLIFHISFNFATNLAKENHILTTNTQKDMLDVFLILMGILCLITGLAGCFPPVIPGPPVAYAGLLLLHFTDKVQYSATQLLLWLLIVVIVQVLDYFVPMLGSKYSGGTRWEHADALPEPSSGCSSCPGALSRPVFRGFYRRTFRRQETRQALKSGLGSLFGFLFGTVLKCVLCGYFAWEFASALL